MVAAGQFVVAGFRAGLEKMLFPRGTEGSNPARSASESFSAVKGEAAYVETPVSARSARRTGREKGRVGDDQAPPWPFFSDGH